MRRWRLLCALDLCGPASWLWPRFEGSLENLHALLRALLDDDHDVHEDRRSDINAGGDHPFLDATLSIPRFPYRLNSCSTLPISRISGLLERT
ncbi:hypothetical protein OH77DRAFT_115606 [Trametes cingulata]|nr:hypothetical protein OH77DRAFT_115606 [Trametes cingulata]